LHIEREGGTVFCRDIRHVTLLSYFGSLRPASLTLKARLGARSMDPAPPHPVSGSVKGGKSMTSANNGRWLLRFLDDWAGRAFRRLVEAVESETENTYSDRDAHVRAERLLQELLESALLRKQIRLLAVFGNFPQTSQSRNLTSELLLEQLRVTQRTWMEAVQALADDNELDVPWSDGNGCLRPAIEIVVEAILDDAVLASRLAEIRCL
jgi:hypothetical protein